MTAGTETTDAHKENLTELRHLGGPNKKNTLKVLQLEKRKIKLKTHAEIQQVITDNLLFLVMIAIFIYNPKCMKDILIRRLKLPK